MLYFLSLCLYIKPLRVKTCSIESTYDNLLELEASNLTTVPQLPYKDKGTRRHEAESTLIVPYKERTNLWGSEEIPRTEVLNDFSKIPLS